MLNPIMKITFKIHNQLYTADTGNPIDISIPLQFNQKQPTVFGASQATSKAYQSGGFMGDTRRGGSVNCEGIYLIPHCNGTHTESVGHISLKRISVNSTLRQFLIPSLLITVKPVKASNTNDSYIPPKNEKDFLITEKLLASALDKFSSTYFYEALIIRTLPNNDTKKTRNYNRTTPPFFSKEAMQKIALSGVKHLLVDIPTIDRLNDDGLLNNHRIFWDVKPGNRNINPLKRSLKTITEMFYAKPAVKDGYYLLNLMIPSFESDAAPSKPVLYRASQK